MSGIGIWILMVGVGMAYGENGANEESGLGEEKSKLDEEELPTAKRALS
jgi:hypothetical protein